jgi:hypothetical protein
MNDLDPHCLKLAQHFVGKAAERYPDHVEELTIAIQYAVTQWLLAKSEVMLEALRAQNETLQ